MIKSLLTTLALVESQVAEAVELATNEEELFNVLAQVNESSLDIDLQVQNFAQIGKTEFKSRPKKVEHTCSTAHQLATRPLPDFYG